MKTSALRHVTAALGLSALAVSAAASLAPSASTAGPHWVDGWAASPDSAGPPLAASTLRQVVRTSIGGAGVRIRLSNLFGSGPITLGPVHVAAYAGGSAIRPGTDHALTFGGQTTVTIAKGADVLSDPAMFPVSALEELAVTLYVAPGAGASTTHLLGQQTAFIAQGADAATALSLPKAKPDDSRYFLTDVQVAAAPEAHTLVALGDSITDGAGSTENRNTRWPDALAARLHADPAFSTVAVVDAGIAGNRILHDGADPFLGPSALSRFERDAVDASGVQWILVLEGINDIAASGMLKTPEANVSAGQIIDGMKALITRAHAKHLKIWGATLTPFAGAAAPFYTAAGEAKRTAVNHWIRTGGAFDAVVDFDQAVRDPAHPERLLPAFDSGDHVHPNDAGYKAMAAAIDPRLFAASQ
jgi:lysophospholipase L1-like esterase